jgi:hypothetical protein
VVVVSTRDCSLQRRHQKLVEEAPAPFLSADQERRLYESSKAILKAVGYEGAGTCEFLVAQDGTILCFYGSGSKPGFAGQGLTLARFNLEWLTDGKDSPGK